MGRQEPDSAERYVVAIDPGLTGAIAVVPGAARGYVLDMPTQQIDGKSVLDLFALANLLRENATKSSIVVVEQQWARPGQGVSSTFSIGFQFGAILGVCRGLGLDVQTIPPATWKKSYPELLDLDKAEAKSVARQAASALYPDLKDRLKRVKDHGRAEALLIAFHALRFLSDSEGGVSDA